MRRHWGKEKTKKGNFYYKGIQLGSFVRRPRKTHGIPNFDVPVSYLRLPCYSKQETALVTRLDIEL